ncbi:hypothetical protein A8139_08035 [Marinomonas primoryensis]|jgi:hypothetical protein|uniref:Uncharacterized protein n=2 Tax=Marinomonas primoryensis TaxID=178399 RepID=A0A2Z4PXV4_9GAMM|nr:hypothetical protein A8139_08035 [Marinomonas primoryensis]
MAVFIIYTASFIPSLIIIIFLTIKLRKKKYSIINDISKNAPSRFKKRALLLIESNPSWVFACSVGQTWYSYIMLRYGWKISKIEIKKWHNNIELVFQPYHVIYKANVFLINTWIAALPILIILVYTHKYYP